jgi:hypothetical protein
MNTWAPLWSGIVDSSIWLEDDVTVKVFLTMMAKKDSDHVVRANAFMIGQWAKKTEAEVLAALKVLSSPDTKRLEPQPFEGRRIQKVEDGWLILNGEFYRQMVAKEMEKARWRRASTSYRERKKTLPKKDPKISGGYRSREKRFEKADGAGDEKGAEAILEEGLPRP